MVVGFNPVSAQRSGDIAAKIHRQHGVVHRLGLIVDAPCIKHLFKITVTVVAVLSRLSKVIAATGIEALKGAAKLIVGDFCVVIAVK